MKEINRLMQIQFDKMCQTGKLFIANVDGYELSNLYVESFPDKYNPVFRDPESSTHNCNNCKNFIKNYGNIIAFDEDYNIMTIWDIETNDEYRQSFNKCHDFIKNAGIGGFFVEDFYTLNVAPYETTKKNNELFKLGMGTTHKQYTFDEVKKFGVVEENKIYSFNHLHVFIPNSFILKSESKASVKSDRNSNQQVFKRGLDEINIDTLELVLDLIGENAILNGTSHVAKIEEFLKHKNNYNDCKDKLIYSYLNYDSFVSKFRNELVGVLCVEIQTKGLEKAILEWNKRVDPVNYKKASSPISKKQIQDAQNFVAENGYEESFVRRCATMDDINAQEILHLNEDKKKHVSIFDTVKATKQSDRKFDFSNVPEISIDKFMSEILPQSSSMEVFVENKHKNNFVTLITSENKDSKKLFSWNNNFSWTYNGNLSGKSAITENVKAVGGMTDCPFRFSIMWNEDGNSIVDLDAHCRYQVEASNYHVYYGRGYTPYLELDIDMINPTSVGIENIFSKNNPEDGTYYFYIRNFNDRVHSGGKAEIIIFGVTYTYSFDMFRSELKIATITVQNGSYEISHHAKLADESSSTIYNIDTKQFHNVNLVCKSPNYWDCASGNLHYFFFIEGCKCDDLISTFHPELLNSELSGHRKVIQALSHTMKIKCTDDQLSGLGFNSTMKEELIVKTNNKLFKIKF